MTRYLPWNNYRAAADRVGGPFSLLNGSLPRLAAGKHWQHCSCHQTRDKISGGCSPNTGEANEAHVTLPDSEQERVDTTRQCMGGDDIGTFPHQDGTRWWSLREATAIFFQQEHSILIRKGFKLGCLHLGHFTSGLTLLFAAYVIDGPWGEITVLGRPPLRYFPIPHHPEC